MDTETRDWGLRRLVRRPRLAYDPGERGRSAARQPAGTREEKMATGTTGKRLDFDSSGTGGNR